MRLPRGGEILATALLLNVALVVAALALEGTGEEAIRIVVRHTAKLAVVFLVLAFSASSLQTLRPSAASRWMLANRRMLGLSCALSHTLHLLGLVALHVRHPETGVMAFDPVNTFGGGGAYVFLWAMAATSWDGAITRMGRANWRRLHTLGGWYLWVVFFQSYAGRTAMDPATPATIFTILLLAAAGLRFERFRRRRAAAAASVPA